MTHDQLEPALFAIRKSPYPYVTEAMIRLNGGKFINGEYLAVLADLQAAKVLGETAKDGRMTINRKALAVLSQKQDTLFDM